MTVWTREYTTMLSVPSVCLLAAVLSQGVNAFRVLEVDGEQTVLAVENEKIEIYCEDDVPMSYCGFTHPNGTRFSFAGSTLDSGQCRIELKVVSRDSGRWTCHIGKKDETGEEITKTKHIRVAGRLAAVLPNVTAAHGRAATLVCTTAQTMTPLSYCRFVPPRGKPFSIDSAVTRNNSIFGRYYFPANKSLDRGDCAVTIRRVTYDDVGAWVCGAWLEEEAGEFVDVIELQVEGIYTLSTASVTGITFGVIVIVGVLCLMGFAAWRKQTAEVAEVAPEESIEIEQLERLRERSPARPAPAIRILSPSEPSTTPHE